MSRLGDALETYSETEFGKALGDVITSLAKRANNENQKTDAWKDLFEASEGGLRNLLSEADRQSGHILRLLGDVIEKKFEIKMSNRLYLLLKALPVAMWELRENIDNTQGMSCCADKARKVYYDEVLAEINRIKESK